MSLSQRIPTEEQILRAVAEITSSPAFQKSDRITGLLKYLVTETLRRPDTRITAESIAASVFNRGADFVNVDDPIVRTTMSRLRSALANRYQDPECQDLIEIRISKGNYSPQFFYRSQPAAPPLPVTAAATTSGDDKPWALTARSWAFMTLLLGIVAFSSVAALGFKIYANMYPQPQHSTIFVMPVQVLSGDATTRQFGADIDTLLLAKLAAFNGAEIVDMAARSGKPPSRPTGDLSSYTLQTTVWQDQGASMASWQLLDPDTGFVVWSAPEALRETEASGPGHIADAIAEKVLGTGGAVMTLNRRIPDAGRLALCLAKSPRFIFVATDEELRKTTACLEKSVAETPDFADGWGVLSYAYQQLKIDAASKGEDPNVYGEKARHAAARARELAPDSFLTQTALAYIALDTGDADTYRLIAMRLLDRYPGDPDLKIRVGAMLANLGDEKLGMTLMSKGMAAGGVSSRLAFEALALDAYMREDFQSVLDNLQRVGNPSDYILFVLAAATYGQMSDTENARKTLDRLLDGRPDYAHLFWRDAETRMMRKPIRERLADGLRKAGLNLP